MIRRQLPVFSPLPLGALLRSSFARGAETRLGAAIRERFSTEDVLLCGSGTQALQLAIQAVCASNPRGDVVALPAFACYDLASAAIGADVKVVFYDIDPETLLPRTESLVRALGRGPAAVVIAPLFGYQPDWDELRSLTAKHGVVLIEDAAQSFGAAWRGRFAGGLGDLSILSFGRGKGWTAVEGGALLGPSSVLESLRQVAHLEHAAPGSAARTLFKGVAQWGLGRPTLYGIPSAVPGLELGETVYHPPVTPRALSRRSARLALETLELSTREAESRRHRAQAMVDFVRETRSGQLRVPPAHGSSEPGYLRLPMLATAGPRRLLLERGRALGIMPGYPVALPELPPLISHVADESTHAGANALVERLVTLPTHSMLTGGDMSRILALLRAADGC